MKLFLKLVPSVGEFGYVDPPGEVHFWVAIRLVRRLMDVRTLIFFFMFLERCSSYSRFLLCKTLEVVSGTNICNGHCALY